MPKTLKKIGKNLKFVMANVTGGKVNFLKKGFEPIDFIALIILVGGAYLKLHGADGTVSLLLVFVATYYFGKKASNLPNSAKDILDSCAKKADDEINGEK
jgi:hypothetical protein